MKMRFSLPGGKRDLIEKAGSSIFISVAIASVVLAFSIVSIKYMVSQMQYNSRVHAAKEIARDTLESNLARASKLEASYLSLDAASPLIPARTIVQDDETTTVKKNSAIVLDALPRRYDFPALRTSVDVLATLSGVSVSGFRGDDFESEAIASLPNPEPQEIVFGVTIEGNYNAVNQFVENLENTIRPMKVTKMRLTGSDSFIVATLDVVTYYQPSVDLTVQTRVIE